MNMNFQKTLLEKILSHQCGVHLPEKMVHPYYEGASIRNIPASILKNFGAQLPDTTPLLPEIEAHLFSEIYDHIGLFLIDGLGYDWFLNYLQAENDNNHAPKFWNEIMNNARISPLTSISPSTTAAALTTYWTGASPAAHGVLGYEMWLKEFGILGNMILHGPAAARGAVGALYNAGMEPENFVPVPTIARALADQGVAVQSMQHYSIVNSGLSTTLDNGARRMPFKCLADLFCNYEQALSGADAPDKSYTWLYYSEHDSLGHPYGVSDPRVHHDFAGLGFMLSQFLRRARTSSTQKRLLLISADHGHLVTPKDPKYDLVNYPDVEMHLAMAPSGDNRLPYFYVKPGHEQALVMAIETHFSGDEFAILKSEDALKDGLFGPEPHFNRSADRIGNYVLIPQGTSYLWWSDRPNPLLGRHVGLSRTEMVVPLIAVEY